MLELKSEIQLLVIFGDPRVCGKMGGAMGKDSSGGLSPNRKLLSLTDYLPGFVTYHCAMIGLDMSGKTTVLYRLKFDQYVSAAPTIGFNCEKVRGYFQIFKNEIIYCIISVLIAEPSYWRHQSESLSMSYKKTIK